MISRLSRYNTGKWSNGIAKQQHSVLLPVPQVVDRAHALEGRISANAEFFFEFAPPRRFRRLLPPPRL